MVRFIRLLLNEKGRFLWSAHRITERQKAGKARNIKGKQLKNSRNTVSKQLVAHLSSARDNLYTPEQKENNENTICSALCILFNPFKASYKLLTRCLQKTAKINPGAICTGVFLCLDFINGINQLLHFKVRVYNFSD